MESSAYEVLILPALSATFGAIVVGAIGLFLFHAIGALAGYLGTVSQSLEKPFRANDQFLARLRRPVAYGVGSVRRGLNSRGASTSVRGILPH